MCRQGVVWLGRENRRNHSGVHPAAARSWGRNSLRVSRVLLPPQFIALLMVRRLAVEAVFVQGARSWGAIHFAWVAFSCPPFIALWRTPVRVDLSLAGLAVSFFSGVVAFLSVSRQRVLSGQGPVSPQASPTSVSSRLATARFIEVGVPAKVPYNGGSRAGPQAAKTRALAG